MASYASDEEQVEALKRWWKENGSSLLTGVLIVLAVYFGIGQFQDSRTAESGRASELYQQLSELALAKLSEPVSEDELLSAQAVYSQLKSDYENSIYTRYAALLMARFQVEQGQVDMAANELQWVLDNPGVGFMNEADPELFVVTRLRLARLRLAQGDARAAQALLDAEPVPEAFMAGYAEVEGDVQLALGNRDAAREDYLQAFNAQQVLEGGSPMQLRLKLQELGVNPTEVP